MMGDKLSVQSTLSLPALRLGREGLHRSEELQGMLDIRIIQRTTAVGVDCLSNGAELGPRGALSRKATMLQAKCPAPF